MSRRQDTIIGRAIAAIVGEPPGTSAMPMCQQDDCPHLARYRLCIEVQAGITGRWLDVCQSHRSWAKAQLLEGVPPWRRVLATWIV